MPFRVDDVPHRLVQSLERIRRPEIALPNTQPPKGNIAPIFTGDVPQIWSNPFPVAFEDVRDREFLDLKLGKGIAQHALDAVASWMPIGADECDADGPSPTAA